MLEGGEVAFGVQAVQPLLVDDRAQAAAYRVAARWWVARRRDRVRLAAEHVVGERRDDVVNGAHAVGAQFEHLVQGWSRVRVVRHARVGLHLVGGRPSGLKGCGRPRFARRTHASVANTRWRSVWMNEYSPSTRSYSRSGGKRLARSTVGGHARSMIAHASRKPSALAGSSFLRSG